MKRFTMLIAVVFAMLVIAGTCGAAVGIIPAQAMMTINTTATNPADATSPPPINAAAPEAMKFTPQSAKTINPADATSPPPKPLMAALEASTINSTTTVQAYPPTIDAPFTSAQTANPISPASVFKITAAANDQTTNPTSFLPAQLSGKAMEDASPPVFTPGINVATSPASSNPGIKKTTDSPPLASVDINVEPATADTPSPPCAQKIMAVSGRSDLSVNHSVAYATFPRCSLAPKWRGSLAYLSTAGNYQFAAPERGTYTADVSFQTTGCMFAGKPATSGADGSYPIVSSTAPKTNAVAAAPQMTLVHVLIT